MRHMTQWIALAASAGTLAGCSLDVTNPGPIEDTKLQTPDAVPALVVGMSADYANVYDEMVRITAIASDELGHGGSYTQEGLWVRGIIRPEDVNGLWSGMHRARFEAESGIDRFKAFSGASFDYGTSVYSARANLFAGLTNRLLGETVCGAVFDNGPLQSDSAYFQRADTFFTEAIKIALVAKGATDVLNAAYGGRASVRAWLGNWDAAIADAALVPTAFVYNAIFSSNSTRENNSLVQETYVRREFSLYNTSWAQVFKDPRVPWDTIKTSNGAIQTGQDGKTPYFRQAKYIDLGADIPVVKGTEMRLLQAEAALRKSNIPSAYDFMNQARANYKMAALTPAADLATAWKTLEFERGATLWLEARRLWDLRRWGADSGPAKNTFLAARDKAVPVSLEEYQTNPNFAGMTPQECQ
ncbi:MAG TPA: RagB/SusD family nutrient uptake outer membrane protein [Gemmatimonadaceae bacterium]|nr:RagB/SusD family nutrient uptake outer membrane protein [Gemmatimonadaceae bacterium]